MPLEWKCELGMSVLFAHFFPSQISETEVGSLVVVSQASEALIFFFKLGCLSFILVHFMGLSTKFTASPFSNQFYVCTCKLNF